MSSKKQVRWRRQLRELSACFLWLALGGAFLFMGFTQPTYTEANTMEIYAESKEVQMTRQNGSLYPSPLLICADGAEYSFGESCYRKLPSDFNSKAHSIRVRVYTGYNWRFWDKTPEIAELEADGEICFSLRDSNRGLRVTKVFLIAVGIIFTSLFILSIALEISTFPEVEKYFRAREKKRREKKRKRNS